MIHVPDVVEIIATLPVTDRNDESPVFLNAPKPYLATVAATETAGVTVYELFASDDDANSNVTYGLVSVTPEVYKERFEVVTQLVEDPVYGLIRKGYLRTKGSGRYPEDQEIRVDVSARDLQGDQTQLTVVAVHILVGVRPPQFFEDPYYGYMLENSPTTQMVTTKDGYELVIQVKKFQKGKITFDLYDDASQPSSVFSIDDDGRIYNLQVLDYESVDRSQQPLQYRLVLWVHEDLGPTTLSSNTTLIIEVQDTNDNKPEFETSQHLKTIAENLPVDASVLEVKAEDLDAGVNAEIEYSVESDYFYVETDKRDEYSYVGIIKVKSGLDYDRNPSHLYEITVYATDKGTPPKSSSVNILITVTNVNDESPEFTSTDTVINVDENAPIGTVIAIVQAVDLDGDTVSYYFSPRSTEKDAFRIDPTAGLITLARSVLEGADLYPLNITAYDDGACCGGGSSRSNDSYIVVRIVDVNTHKPTFDSCSDYSNAKMKEHAKIGDRVIQVQAKDEDRGDNGKVTVNGIDGANPPLDGWCTFRVEVEDINDNQPKFDLQSYSADITSDTQLNQVILPVRAYDADIGLNGEIEYSLVHDAEIFGILPTGFIFLARNLIGQTSYELTVMAKDKGTPPLNSTVKATISVAVGTSNPPTWDKKYDSIVYEVDETAPVGTLVATMSCNSNIEDKRVEFQIIQEDGSSSQSTGTFAITYTGNTMYLNVDGKLDYETINSYTVRLRCLNFGPVTLQQEVNPTIRLIDKNDEQPYFRGTNPQGRYPGSVPENMDKGQDVITITGYDDDYTPRYSELKFSLERPNDDFEIVPGPTRNTAIVRTKSRFDRETKSYYDLTVVAEDSVNSDRPGHMPADTPNSARVTVEVIINDQNDNEPYFKKPLYEVTVAEDQYIDTAFTYITAEDPDETDKGRLNYLIIAGNAPLYKFGVRTATGGLFVAKTLDFESDDHNFELTLNASDGIHTASTKVKVTVLDANDNAPEFIDTPFRIEGKLVEEDDSVLTQPKRLLTVTATDRDVKRPNQIRYSLQGYGTEAPNKFFTIDPVTGELFVIKPLDRDAPLGRANYQFTVVAKDEPNQPWQFGYATVEVLPEDINDNRPTFDPDLLKGSVAEHSKIGSSVMYVLATDPDNGKNGTVVYEIIQNSIPVGSSRGYFTIDRQTGLIKTNVDMSDLDRETIPSFTLDVRASDEGSPPLYTTSTVTISLSDINDKWPVFSPVIYRTEMSENQKSGEVIRVWATDADMGHNAKLTYSLKEGDSRFFQVVTIDNMGSVLVYEEVDYEQATQQFFNLTVIAQDPDPDHTATAHIEITVRDFNDNAPSVAPPVLTKEIFEDEEPGYHIATFNATDKDSGDNAKFETACDPPMTGTGTLTVVVKDINDNFPQFLRDYQPQVFDREAQKYYYIPIVMWDMRGKNSPKAMTGTNTLTVTIADINDNQPKPGHQDIFVYNYKGLFGPLEIGRVFVEDEDDWDLPDKTFTFAEPRWLEDYFVVNSSTGMVTMQKGVPGTTAEEFIVSRDGGKSKKEVFHELFAEKMGLPKENIDIITVMDFERVVGIKIQQVPIDACAEEQFEGGCFNFMNITGQPAMVNANGTSFVGVEVLITARQGCRALEFPDPNECTGEYCYHGGTCMKDDWGVLSCQCQPGFDGPRCQQRRHSFDGDSFALYPTLEQCEESQTTIEFITQEDDGLLLYNGPMAEIDLLTQPEDFISLELLGGYPRLMVNHGTGTLTLSLDGQDEAGAVIMQRLSDGQWHRIDIIRSGKDVEMVVDYCRSVKPLQDVQLDTRPCRIKGRTPGENTFLNVNTLLQLGGRFSAPSYPQGITASNFNGCLRNLVHNGKLYDLYYKSTADFNSGFNGCPREDQLCEELEIQMRLRTRDENGVLFTAASTDNTQTITLEIHEGHVRVLYNLGDGEQQLELSQAPVSNGQWHTVNVKRYLQQMTLTLDGGEGRNYNFSRGNPKGKVNLVIQRFIFAGASISYSQDIYVLTRDLNASEPGAYSSGGAGCVIIHIMRCVITREAEIAPMKWRIVLPDESVSHSGSIMNAVLLLGVFMLVKFRRRDTDSDKYILEVDPEDDIRENVINYDEEGAGEEDQDAYDISRLQKTDLDPLNAFDAPRYRERPLRSM
nr:hypothetical protein BaRGS_014591 [Batillaria attramentaria]